MKARKFSWLTRLLTKRAVAFSVREGFYSTEVDKTFLTSKASYERKLYYCQERLLRSQEGLNNGVVDVWLYENAEKEFLFSFINYCKPSVSREDFSLIQKNKSYDIDVFIKLVCLMHSELIKTEKGLDFIYGQDKSFYNHTTREVLAEADIIHKLQDGKLFYILQKYSAADMEDLEALPDTWLITMAEQFFDIPRKDKYSNRWR